jgi:tetratricopeptide (TPR) repeat protein
MKPIRLVLLFSMICLMAAPIWAQKNKGKENSPATPAKSEGQIDIQKKVFRMALENGDLNAAKTAVYNLVAMNADGGTYSDTLIHLYFQAGSYNNVVRMGNAALEQRPDDQPMLTLVAIAEQALGLDKEALAHYEKLFALTDDVYYLYQVASVQFMLERFGECRETVDKVVAREDAKEREIILNFNQGEQPINQKVPIAAAALNIKGFVEMKLSNKSKAREAFNEAVKIFPEFQLAIINLLTLDEEMAKDAKENGTEPEILPKDPNK